MITHWLIPGQRLNVIMLFSTYIKIPDASEGVSTPAEIAIRAETQEESNLVKKTFHHRD